MANIDQIKALIKSHTDGDSELFYSIALQMAAHAKNKGHSKISKELKDLVQEAKDKGFNKKNCSVIPISQPRGELSGLLSVKYSKDTLSQIFLLDKTKNKIKRIIKEQRQKSALAKYGLSPRHRILFHGPPGTGKTMTASVLAGELNLPLYTIMLDSLITKFMGETASKLRLIFDHIQTTKGIYFFDEFDALGADRAAGNDVGEIRRILNSILQFLEQDHSESIILAATNHVNIIDKALFRRFDDLIEFELPTKDIISEVIQNSLCTIEGSNKLDFSLLSDKCIGFNISDIKKICDNSIKEIILSETEVCISNNMILECIEDFQRN